MPLLRRAIALTLSAVMALGQPTEVLAASYVFRQPTTAGTFPIPTITNNVVAAQTYYKVDGRSYSISWQGTGGRSPYLFEMVGTPLPAGCSTPLQTGSILSTACTFATDGNTSGVIVQLTDANGMVVRDNAPTIHVSAPSPTLGTYSFPFTGSVGTPYTGSLRISGGRQPFNVSRATGDLPPGLSLSTRQDVNTGVWSVVLSGSPTTPGSFTFDILVTDANQKQVTSSKVNVSVSYGPVSLTLRSSKTTGVFSAVAGKPIRDAGVNIVGGTPPVALSQLSGSMPPGVSLALDGLLDGTPTTPGTYSGIQVKAVDSNASPKSATSPTFSVVVATELVAVVQGANDAYVRNSPIPTISTAVSGGTAPYTYALNGTVPPGLSFSNANGRITGTPTVAGQFGGLSVTATDANGYVVETSPFSINVADPLVISGTPPRGAAGSAYSFTFGAAGGQQPYSFSIAQGSLPFGLALSSSGTISGTPFVAGTTSNLVVRVTDANGTTKDTAPFSITLADQLTVASGPAGAATTGVGYSSDFAAAGGTAPYSFALVSGSLPPGLSLATSGAISGTPTAAGSYGPFSVRVVDADGTIATADATIVVSSPLTIAGAAPGGMVGADYSSAFTAAGGSAPYSYDIAAGALPDGLSLNGSTGRISGKPTKAGTFSGITVRATDASGRRAQTTVSIAIAAPLRIAGTPADTGTIGQTYSASFGASGGTAPYAFSLASGTLPAGLNLSPTSGAISGTPTAAGLAEGLTVKVTDAAGRTAVSDAFRIAVTEVLAVSGSASSSAIAGQTYSAQFSASGGTGPYAWTLASGTLPPGLSLEAASGQISGTPTALGSYPGLQVRATDAASRTALSAIFGISVSSSLSIAGNPAGFATVGQPYTAVFTASGGVGAKTFSLATGQLPAGLTFDPASGLISGTPTAKGMSPAIAVRVRDASNSAATAPAFDLYVSDPLVVSGIPGADATVGSTYSGNATVAGGRPAYAWTLDAGTLPPGLQLSSVTGVIAGTPTQAGTASGLRLRATDVDGRTGTTDTFAISVAAPLTVAGQTSPGTVGQTYSAQFTASGGLGPYGYQIVGAALPAGLSLDATSGQIAGTPTTAAAGGTMQIRATDAKGRTVSTASFTIDVRDPLRLVPSNIGPGTVGQAYSAAMTPAGGRGPFVLTVAEGSLPPGLVIERTTGAIGGTPTQAGSYPGIVIAAVDADGRTARSEAFGIDVAIGLAVAGVPPQPATVGVPYSFAFSASGGQAPYAWTISGGNLPVGLGIESSSGAIGGTPTRAGSVTGLSAVVADRARRTGASQPFAIDVRDPISVSGDPARVAILGQPYAASFTATGGRGPYIFAMVGTLPAGLTLSTSTGAISGTPATAGDATDLRVRATDADGRTATSSAFSIATSAPLVLAGAPSASGDVGVAYSAAFTASGGTSPYVYSLSAGALPTGLSLDTATGRISGTPTAAGTATGLQVAVVDANGTRVASQVFSIAIADPLTASADIARATVGTTYAARVVASGGRPAYAYALASGTLPGGLSLDTATGRIAGTPGAAGTSGDLQVRVSDADGRSTLTPAFRIVVDGPLVLASIPAQTATIGIAYDSTAAAGGGRAPYSYTLATGTLPAGLTLDATTGRISGTPTTIGASENLSLTVRDADGRTATSRTFRIDVRDAMAIAGATSPFGTTGQVYGPFQFTASGGRGPYVYEMVGTLPAGVSLSGTGVLSGSPTRGGTSIGLQVRATDQDGRTALSAAFDIQVSAGLLVTAALPGAATTGNAYAGTASATGGRAPYVFGLAAGTLPPGLSLDTATGAVGGTPTTAGSYAGISVKATDADGRMAAAAPSTILVSDPLSASISPAPAVRSTAYLAQVAVQGGRGGYTYALAAGTLPAGLSLNASTGAISGTPTTVQIASNLQVRVTDADGRTALTPAFAISVAPALSLSVRSPLAATIGTGFTAAATAAGGRTAYGYDLAAGTLPAGLTLDAATGAISGTPSAVGRSTVTLRVTDADGRTATVGTTISVVDPMVLAASNSDAVATVGQPFSRGLAVVGGQSPYGYALASGTLPPGLSLSSSTGTIAGTPSQVGTFGNLSILVTDAEGRTAATAAFVIDVRPALAFSGIPSAVATVGVGYDSSALVTGGDLPYAFSLAAGTLPAGLSLTPSTGRIIGTPTTIGIASGLQLRAVDRNGRVALSAPFAIDVRGAMTVAGYPDPNATVSTSYGPYQFAATGGRSSYTYTAVGSLPPGLTLSSAGTLSGVPYAAGTYAGLQVRATDQDGRIGLSAAFSIDVVGPVSVTASLPPNGTVDTAYQGQVSASGGRPGYVYYVAAGSLPPGLNLDPISGVVSGSPTQVGTFGGIQIAAMDADGRTQVTTAYQILVGAPLALAYSPAPATRGSGFAIFPSVSGGRAPYRFVMSSGTLPTGLTLNATSGAITGVPTAVQTATLQVMLIDADGRWTISSPFTIDVAPALSLSLAPAITIAVGTATEIGGTAAGGRTPYAFAANGGVPGMTFNTQTGRFEGTPTTGGSYPATIVVTDAAGRRAQASTTVTASAPLVIKPPALLYVDYGRAYTGAFTATGGSPGYSFAVTAGSLPYGITMSSTGQVGGSTTRYGSSFFTVTVTDKAGLKTSVDVNMIVNDGLSMDSARPQDPDIDGDTAFNDIQNTGWVGQFYGGQLTIRNAIGPVTVSVTPALPAGIATRVEGNQVYVTGVPTSPVAQQYYNFVATDSVGRSGGRVYGGPYGAYIEIRPMVAPGWSQDTTSFHRVNEYALLKLADRTPGTRDFAMSKDGRVIAYSNVGTTGGDGVVNVMVDTGRWVETYNHGFAKAQRILAPSLDSQNFGKKIALSRDGTYLAVSAPFTGSTYYVGSAQKAYVYVYKRNGSTWELFSTILAPGLTASTSLAISDDGMRVAYPNFTYVQAKPADVYQTKYQRISIRAWNGSQYAEEFNIACKNSASECGMADNDLKFSSDGSTLAFTGIDKATILKMTNGGWQQQYETQVFWNGNSRTTNKPQSLALNTDGTKMLLSQQTGLYTPQGSLAGYGWAIYAYAWDGRMWSQVGMTSGRYQNMDWYVRGIFDTYMSASDDLSTFVRYSGRDGRTVYDWAGYSKFSTGISLSTYQYTGPVIMMSGDGNTIFNGSEVSKKTWPSSR
ncbi:putative Ig domain-containing protein [Methylobacterium radiotolerans]|uniref:putative Ig domain-containing protein n=1 Tax=Methylobacterium radiotolerans TaxID=31998 RepID=UPI0038CF99AA